MDSKQALLDAFEQMENERKSVCQKLSEFSDQALSEKPGPDQWSVAEIIMHLVVAETAALNYMRKKLEFGGHQRASLGAGMKQQLLNFLISLPIKFKAPKVIEFKETQGLTFADASQKWEAVRMELFTEYKKLDSETVGHELFKHPAMGKMNLVQGVKFMRQHMNRHIGQIEKTLKKVA